MGNIKENKLLSEKCCVVIPTFNNDKTLEKVLRESLNICKNIVVINDGSTDNTSNILKKFKGQINVIIHKKNQGKGKSLRDAFEYAIRKKFKYAITIDSDGQHYPTDINLFIEAISKYPESIIIGARDMTQEGVPKKSSFGNKFSNFWFFVETGISLSDTQTGFRLYPLNQISQIKFFTTRFEFEIEVLVRMVWNKTPIKEIPIKVKYDTERISHFRPFQDFIRISLLNTVLVTIALVYHIPLRLFYSLYSKEIIRRRIAEFFSQEGTIFQKSISIGVVACVGILPIWGFQMLFGLLLSYIFKLNKIIVLLFSNISIPPLIPFILFGSYYIGNLLIGGGVKIIFSRHINIESIKIVLQQYIIGSIILSLIVGFIFFLLSYLILNASKSITEKK